MILRLIKWKEEEFSNGDDAEISDIFIKVLGICADVMFFRGGFSISIGRDSKYELKMFSKKKRPDLMEFTFTDSFIEFGAKNDRISN